MMKEQITIVCENEKEQEKMGNHIHNQLHGNQDYIDSNIILNMDIRNAVNIYVFEECKERPTITI